ncbi:MAG: hypothetical protein R3E42_08135 [Burkholderiaceae bacterium]
MQLSDLGDLMEAQTTAAIAAFLASKNRRQLDTLAAGKRHSMHTLGK